MIETDRSRIAAILDCEGWISIEKCNNPGIGLVLTVGVGNTNRLLIDWLHTSFGGCVYTRKPPTKNSKYVHVWKIHSTRAMDVLKEGLPYFLLKRAQADTAIMFQEIVNSVKGKPGLFTDAYREYTQSLKRKMNQLNRKGTPATTERDDTPIGSEATV